MRSHRNPLRPLAALLGAGAIALSLIAVPAASAAPAAVRPLIGTAGADFSASGDVSLLKVSGDLGGTNLATVDLAHSNANAATATSDAYGKNTGTLTALAGNVDLTTVLAQASQSAPPVAPTADSHTLIPIPADPLANVTVSDATARAAWAGAANGCPATDSPLSLGTTDTAGLDILTAAGAPSLLDVGPPNSGQVSLTQAANYLAADPDPNANPATDPRRVEARVNTQVAGVDLLTVSGQPPLLHVGVAQPYGGTVFASGKAGGAGDTFQDPVVNLTIAGNTVINLTSGQSTTVQPTGGSLPTLDALLQQLSPLLSNLTPILSISVPPVVHNAAADGTSASISGALLQVDVLSALGTPPLLSLTLAPFAASAAAPAGGITCLNPENPIKVNKTASKSVVKPGESFDFTITFTNTNTSCTLTNTSLTDVITGPDGSSIDATDPQGTVSGLTVTWPSAVVGDIGPGVTKTFVVTVKTSATAKAGDSFSDTATANGDCNGTAYVLPFTLNNIPTVAADLLARTGIDSTFPLLGAGALVLAALGFRRLRRV